MIIALIWIVELSAQMAMFMIFKVFLPVLSVVLRIIFTLIASYPKVFLALTGLGLIGVLIAAGLGRVQGVATPSQPLPATIQQADPTALPQPTTPDTPAAPTPVRQAAQVRQVTRDVNLRTGPGVAYGVMQVLSAGTEVEVLDETQEVDGGTWVKVRLDGQEGWMNQKFLR